MADRDPNEILSEGWIGNKKGDYEGLKIPSGVDEALVGSQFYGYQRTYKNGRRVIEWYKRGPGAGVIGSLTGAKPPPDEILTTAEDSVPAIKEKWDKDTAVEAKPDQVATVNGVPSQVVGKDAAGRDIWAPVQTPNGPAAPTPTATSGKPAGSTTQVEGTPLPGGGFDNTRPVMVTRKPDGSVFSQEPLTATERAQWEKEKNGGKTDADIATAATTTPAESVNPSDPTRLRKPDGKGGWTDAGVNQVEVDRRAKEKQAEVDKNKPKPEQAPDGSYGYFDTTKTPPVWVPIQNGPGAKPNAPVQINGVYGVWKPGQNGAAPTFEPIVNQPGRAVLPPDAPPFDGSSPDTAFKSYQALFQYVDAKVRSGEWTAEQGKGILAGPHELTGQLLDRAKEERVTGENLRRDQLTERSQDATVAGNRLSAANTMSSTAIKQSSDLIKAAEGGSSTIVPLMVLQAGMGQAMGGFREQPNVTMRGGGMLPPVPGQPGGTVPTPANPNTVGQPNQLGAGAIGTQMVPSQAAAVSGPPQYPMTPERVQGIMANPVFRPQAPAGMPSPPAAPPMPGQGQDLSTPQAMIPNQVMRSGLGQGTKTADDLERELLSEGYSMEDVRAARQRAEQRYGGMGAVA